MEKKKIKRIIAREGLIVLATVGLGCLLIWIGLTFRPTLKDIFDTVAEESLCYSSFPFGKMIHLGKLLIISYPISWLIRFIIWALRTLREKE